NIPKSFEPERKDRVVQQSGKQMLNLVLNILDVNKYEGMSMVIHFEEKHLGLIAGSAIDQVQFLIGQRGITLINRVDTRIVVRAEAEMIERVLVNLLTNAVKFTPSGGTITLSTRKAADGKVRIEVTDTGEGIAEDKMHLVFQRFGQIVAKKSGTVKSTGLGLAFCKMAVEAHGEEIGVSSEVGQGTTFWFTLQLAFAGDDEMQGMGKPEEREAERIVLTEEERRVLEPIIGQLKAFTVYETDDIEGILATLKQTESENIKRWILQVENTMVALNQTHYLEILKAI
ncbi:MAG: sensor histidine kinase, partial [Bacteroidales bacterium]